MAKDDPEFRAGLLTEAAECLANNEVDVAKSLLRDVLAIGEAQLDEGQGVDGEQVFKDLID